MADLSERFRDVRQDAHSNTDHRAAYMAARERGNIREQAAAAAGRYMVDMKHVVPRA